MKATDIRLVLTCALLLSVIGCTYETSGEQPQTMREKQDQTVRDPINYNPDNENTKPYDISGGSINNFDRNAMKKDLDDVLNP